MMFSMLLPSFIRATARAGFRSGTAEKSRIREPSKTEQQLPVKADSFLY